MNSEIIEKISKSIGEKHEKFLESVGAIPYKVSADYILLLTDITSKINYINSLLKQSGVVDDVKCENFGDYNKMVLSKIGLDFRVEILTNGTSICIRTANGMMGYDTMTLARTWFYLKDGLDWEEFTDKLVDFIHWEMYKNQESANISFDYVMNREDGV